MESQHTNKKLVSMKSVESLFSDFQTAQLCFLSEQVILKTATKEHQTEWKTSAFFQLSSSLLYSVKDVGPISDVYTEKSWL